MPEPIVFKLGLTSKFRIAKCVNVRVGDYYVLPAAPLDAEPIAGSDTLVVCPEIMLVTHGAFELKVPELGAIALHAGDAGSPQRFRGPLRIEATEAGSGYVCLTPRDNSFWQRETGFVAAGGEIVIETPLCDDACLFVATGALDRVIALAPYALSPAGRASFRATQDTQFIHLWR